MMPSRRPPVEGRPRCFFGISLIDFAMNSGYPKSKPRGSLISSAPALTRAKKDCVTQMTQADSVLSTPRTNTSAIDHPMMFPPRDPTRRRFLAVAAVASVISTGTLAAATAMDPSVPQAVTTPRHSGPDPIYAVIEAHRKAALDHNEAERVQFAFDAGGKEGERREEYDRLVALDNVAWGGLTEAG